MASPNDRDPSNYWRDKYLNLLNDYEVLEKSSTQQHEALRRGLVVTSLLAEGQASSIDPLLLDVRNALKPNGTGLANAIDELSRLVASFDHQKAKQSEALLEQLTEATTKLLECPLPKPLLKKVRSVRQQAKKELASYNGLMQQLQGWMLLLNDIASLPVEKTGKGKSWFAQWFSNETKDAVDEPVSERADSTALVQPAEFDHYAQDIAETLSELLNKISVPERLLSLHEGLQQRLSQHLHVYNLVSILEETSSFVIECLENNEVNIEQFLQNLDERLQSIRSLVETTKTVTRSSVEARDAFEGIVRDQLSDMRISLEGSSSIQQLSHRVKDHLSLILEALESYRVDEENREAYLQEQLNTLQNRLNEMEQEVQESRQAFEEQRQKATTDTLTGLPNREAYQQRLIDEHARFHRYGSPLSIIVCDVDYFKKINDTYGHLAGDKVLQLIARSLKRNIREVDFIARYGGEEFVILMPGTEIQQAQQAAEKLRKAVEASPFNFKKERVQITMSFGAAQFCPNEMPDETFDRADKALYQAKTNGRNMVCLAESEQ